MHKLANATKIHKGGDFVNDSFFGRGTAGLGTWDCGMTVWMAGGVDYDH